MPSIPPAYWMQEQNQQPNANTLEKLWKRVLWDQIQGHPWIETLKICPQDPIHHAEGDVWIHTKMVLDVLLTLPAYQALNPTDQLIVYSACLFHDIAKPETTQEIDGRITAKGHSRKGENAARLLLWEWGFPFAMRETICTLIRWHQIPFYLIDRENPLLLAAQVSWSARTDLLAIVAEADIRGRICQDLAKVLDNIALFREFCIDAQCWQQPLPFATDHTRYTFFQNYHPSRLPEYPVFDESKNDVYLMTGLPGAGKDTYIRRHLSHIPMLSLDALRIDLDVDPADNQAEVIHTAYDQARGYLRKNTSFVWNATNLSRQIRSQITGLLQDYKARIHFIHVEPAYQTLWEQNKQRDAKVPENVMRRMMQKWEIIDWTEAHTVQYQVAG